MIVIQWWIGRHPISSSCWEFYLVRDDGRWIVALCTTAKHMKILITIYVLYIYRWR